jgi:hypothetical protein
LDVWGIDHLPDAIVRGESLADRYLELECRARITFETATIAESLHRSADLVLALFSADRSSLAKIGQRLSSGSTLLFQGFTTENRHRTGKPALSRSFDPDVLRELLPDWVWLDLREHDSQKGSSISLLARKG